ncbi:MAG: thioesterase family protein [Acidimicrobiia bacterium]|nr:thioesterase family protein [Acidimicrobiia bacterium]
MRLLHDNLAVRGSGSTWSISADRTWWGHNALFGGYAQAMALAAMSAEVAAASGPGASPMSVRSMSMQFIRPFQDGDYRIVVEVLRRGRSMANVTARVEAGDVLVGYALAGFGVEREVEASNYLALTPPVVEPWRSDEQPVPAEVGVPTHELFDFFPRVGTLTYGGGTAASGGWVRPRFESPVDEALLTVLADLWLPATYQRWADPLVAVSIDITLHFRAPVPDGLAPGTPLLVVLRTAQSGRGVVDEDAEVWSPDGRLLLQGRQMRYVTEMAAPFPA